MFGRRREAAARLSPCRARRVLSAVSPEDGAMRRVSVRVPLVTLPALSVTLAAGLGAQTTGENDSKLAKCERPLGTLAVVEPQDEVIAALQRYQLQSPTSLVRMMVQKSGCFQVVERGAGMRNLMQERELAAGGETQQGSNLGKGQLKAADFVMTPTVLFSEGNAGGVGGAVGGLVGRRLGVGAIGGGLKFKEASTSLLVADVRSGVQVAAAEGKARKTDFGVAMFAWLGGGAGALGGYTNTNEGKVIAASFLDNYNKIVADVQANPELQRTVAAGGAAAAATKAGASYNEGDVVVAKIGGVKLQAAAADGGRVIAALAKGDELVFLGEEKGGWIKVQGGAGEGWVKKTLVAKP